VAGVSAARPLDASARWAETLRGGGRAREDALLRLRAQWLPEGECRSTERRLNGQSGRGGDFIVGMVVLAFIVLVAPLSYFFGVDSRRIDDRGWLAGPRSEPDRQPTLGGQHDRHTLAKPVTA
jgi:hypothetical protein